MNYNRNLLANIYYKVSNSLTVVAFTYFVYNSDFFLNNYFLSLSISAYISTLILINFFNEGDIGNASHKDLLVNVSILNIVLLILSLATGLNALIYSSITLAIILISLSDSFVAKKNQIVERSFKLIFFDLLKIVLFYFNNFFTGNLLLMLLVFLRACPDLKMGVPKYIKPQNKGLLSKNLLSLTKNLESISIFLFVNNGIISSSSMVYIQQAVSAINIFLMTKWQKNIHQKNHFIIQYIKDVSAYIIFLGIVLGFLGFLYDSAEFLMLATLVTMRTIIIDPNLFMTNKFIRKNISFFNVGIFLSGIISIILNEILFYYLTVILLITLIVIKITKYNYIK